MELYCELLEHKWQVSEQASRDVGHNVALRDLVANLEAEPPSPPA